MGLTGRASWILLGVITVTIGMEKGSELSFTRLEVIAAFFVSWLGLHGVAYFLGIKWPREFHYGAQQLFEAEMASKNLGSPPQTPTISDPSALAESSKSEKEG